MPIFEVDVRGELFEVDAPDEQTAISALLGQGTQVNQEGKASYGPEIPFIPSMLMKAGQGVGFGFLDEGVAGATALGSKLTGDDRPIGDIYTESLEGARNVLDRVGEATGIPGDIAEAGGAVASSVALPVGHVARGATLAAKTGAAARAGAVGGGLYGAGEADGGIAERFKSGVKGAAAGAATGVVLAPAVAATGALVNKGRQAIGIGQGAPEQVAARKVSQALERDATNPQAVNAELKAARELSPDAQVADIAGTNTQNLLDAAAMMPGKARKGLVEGLHNRQSRQFMRLQDAIGDAVGDPKKYFETADALMASRAARAKPLYDKAYRTPTPYTQELEGVLHRPLMQQLIRRAKADAENTGEDFQQFFEEVGEDFVRIERVPDTRALDRIKRSLDAMIGATKRGEQTGLKAADNMSLNKLKTDFMKAIKNGPYKRALKTYAGDSALTNALDDGYRAFSKSQPEEISKAIAKLSVDEKDLYRMGMARAIYEKLAQGNLGRNRVEFLKQPAIEGKLRAIFPNAEARRKFMRALHLEDRMFKTRQKVTGGSPTASRQTELQDAGIDPGAVGEGVQMATQVARGEFLAPALRMLTRGKNRMTGLTSEVGDEIIRLLTYSDVSGIERQMAADALKRLAGESNNVRIQQLVTKALAPLTGEQAAGQRPLFAGTVRPVN